MKSLSDYKDEEAIDLWVDLMDPVKSILMDKKVQGVIHSNVPPMVIAQKILKGHKKEAIEILERIDNTPVDGLNILVRLIDILVEIGNNEDIKSFLVFAGQANKQSKPSGLPTGNIEDNAD